MTTDEQEALSRKYSDDVILLLPLKSGSWAVFNNARELCGFINARDDIFQNRLSGVWHPPAKPAAQPAVDLTELGLL